MKWSWKVGNVAGVDLCVHATFFMFLAWIAIASWLRTRSFEEAGSTVLFVVALFVCVLLHEFGHVLTARRYNVATREITLLPIGGLARLERQLDNPRQEFCVAVAGPAVNIAIAGLLYPFLGFTSIGPPIAEMGSIHGFVNDLMAANLFLAAFNVIPAFPMDGGRVLRALLSVRIGRERATEKAVKVGQVLAVMFGIVGLLGNPMLMLIALFVWIAAAQELNDVRVHSALDDASVQQAMRTDFRTLGADDRLSRAVQMVLAGAQEDFPVMENGRFVGVLTHDDLIRALAVKGEGLPVSEVMKREFGVLKSSDALEPAFALFETAGCRSLPVVQDGNVVGLLTADNVLQLLMLRSAAKACSRAA